MHLTADSKSGNGSWARKATVPTRFVADIPLLLPADSYDEELGWNDSWPRRHYWQALLMLSVGLSLLLGALVFLVAAVTLRPGRCSPGTAGAAAATLSSLVLVALLVSTRAVDTPKYE